MVKEMEHAGGCLCGATRYLVIGEPEVTGACHCRYCQLRSGAAFGVLVYFKENNFSLTSGSLNVYEFSSDSGNAWKNQFCATCGTTISCELEVFPGQVGIMGGTFDPPSFWFDLQNEVFVRSKAHFIGEIVAPNKDDTFFSYEPKTTEDSRLSSFASD
jgi:hypothetical protein